MGGRGGGGGGTGAALKRLHATGRLVERFSRLYASGRSLRQIAAETGRSASTVHRLLVNNGIGLRQRGGGRR